MQKWTTLCCLLFFMCVAVTLTLWNLANGHTRPHFYKCSANRNNKQVGETGSGFRITNAISFAWGESCFKYLFFLDTPAFFHSFLATHHPNMTTFTVCKMRACYLNWWLHLILWVDPPWVWISDLLITIMTFTCSSTHNIHITWGSRGLCHSVG